MQNRQRNRGAFRRKAFDNLVFGRQPVLELLAGDKTIDKILIQQSAQKEFIAEIRAKAREKEIPIQFVPVEKLNTLTGGNHQGVIAFTTEIHFEKTEDVIPFLIGEGKVPLLLILDNITDVRNFGAIARTAYAAGVDALIIPASHAAPVNSEAIKASAGALQNISVCREQNLLSVLEYLHLNGIQIFGADANAEHFIYDADFTVPSAIILGSEDKGISGELRRYIDTTIKIPIVNSFDSYNVSVAAGMILYEVMKQRG